MSDGKRRVAAVQMSPVYLDSGATASKMCEFLERAMEKDVELAVFPELMISMYPGSGSREYRERYNRAAVRVPGPETDVLSKVAKEGGMYVVTGLIERDPQHDDVVYNSSIVIDDYGKIVGVHRKIAPVGGEMTYFRKGDARDVRVFDTKLGKVGIGLCFEHLNPLYRRALTVFGEQIHCALWVNTEDLKHFVDSTARVTAIEGGTFVVVAAQFTPGDDEVARSIGCNPQSFIGGSGILNPNGEYVAGPVYNKETIVLADIDIAKWVPHKFQSTGIEARDDLLTLVIRKESYDSYYVVDHELMESYATLKRRINDLSLTVDNMFDTKRRTRKTQAA